MLAICPLATFAQRHYCHVFKVLIETFWKRAYGDWTFGGTPESRVIIHPNPWWGIIMTWQRWIFKVREDVQLLACFVVGAFLFLRMFLPNLVFGWLFGNAGMGYEERLDGSSFILKSLLKEMRAHWRTESQCALDQGSSFLRSWYQSSQAKRLGRQAQTSSTSVLCLSRTTLCHCCRWRIA